MKIYEALIKVLASLLGTASVFPLAEFFISKDLGVVLSDILSVLISTLVILVFEYLFLDIPYNFKWFRKVVGLKLAYIEGAWIEVAKNGERVVSLVNISYDTKSKEYVYTGTAYDKEGTVKAWWSAPCKETDEPYSIEFSGKGHVIDQEVSVRNVGSIAFNSFDPRRPNKIESGNGYFYDYAFGNVRESEDRNEFVITRLKSDTYRKIVGKRKLSTAEDRGLFVKGYYKEYILGNKN